MTTISFSTDEKRVVLAIGYSKDTVKDIASVTGLTYTRVRTALDKLIENGLVFRSDLLYLLTDMGELMFDKLLQIGMKIKSSKKKKRRKKKATKKTKSKKKSSGFLKRKTVKKVVKSTSNKSSSKKSIPETVQVRYSDPAPKRRAVILKASSRSPKRAVRLLSNAKKSIKIEKKVISAKNLKQIDSDIKYFKALSTSTTKLLNGGSSS